MPGLTADEKRWRAEDDARTLARAEQIKEDKSRLGLGLAQAQLNKLAEEQEAEAQAYRKAAGKKPSQKASTASDQSRPSSLPSRKAKAVPSSSGAPSWQNR